MAEAKPFWSALYRSLTLTDREDSEYRRGSIYKNISAIYRIKDDGQNILKVNDCWPGTELNRRRQPFQFFEPKPFFIQQLTPSRWPIYCDHSVTSADVRLSVGAVGLSSTDSGDLKVAKVRIFSSAHSPKARSTALMERRRFSE